MALESMSRASILRRGLSIFLLIDRPLVGVRSVVILIEGMLARPPLLDLIYCQMLTPQSLIKEPAIGLATP